MTTLLAAEQLFSCDPVRLEPLAELARDARVRTARPVGAWRAGPRLGAGGTRAAPARTPGVAGWVARQARVLAVSLSGAGGEAFLTITEAAYAYAMPCCPVAHDNNRAMGYYRWR